MLDSNKKWCYFFIIVFVSLLFVAGAMTIMVDPYFHYHKPLPGLQYPIYNQRYQNDGIVKHFKYDAILTGTSMAENFKTSEFDKIFGVSSVKVPFSGGSYKEINDNLEIAMNNNPNIKVILRCLDYNRILNPPDEMRYEEDDYPTYLYDEVLYNDVEYVFNKAVLFQDTCSVIKNTIEGGRTTDFDMYSNWMNSCTFGKDAVDATYTRAKKVTEKIPITKEDYKNITENITQNVTKLAEKYPETEFYMFFSPYSIYFWDSLNQAGTLERQMEAEKYTIELLLKHENIHLFSFFTEYGMICDLNNYKDIAHYSEDVNSQILSWIDKGKYKLTEENYKEYCESVRKFYMDYDYDSLFE